MAESVHGEACVLAYALVRVIEDRLAAAGLDLNATIDLGNTSIDRTSTPSAEQLGQTCS